MNDDLTPLEPELLDELLSAELDGELDAAAAELGLGIDEIAARLQATPGADDRRLALAQARTQLAQTPAIDELLAARLRAKAVRALDDDTATRLAHRKQRRTRALLGAGGIAAALAAIVAIAAGLGTNTSSSKASSAAKPADAAAPTTPARSAHAEPLGRDTVAPTTLTPALGAFTDARALALAAVSHSAVANASAGTSYDAAAGESHSKTSGSLSLPTDGGSPVKRSVGSSSTESGTATTTQGGDPQLGAASLAPDSSTCASPSAVPGHDSLVLRATATLSGKPVVVLVFAGNGEHIVVIRDTNCKLVNLQTMN